MNHESQDKKKVIIIGPAHPLRGGLASFNERLAVEFQQEGHDVSIFTFSLQYPGFLFPGATQFSSEPAPNNLKIKVVINSVNPLNWLKVGNMIRKEMPDVILVRYWLPFMGPCLGTILRIVKKNAHTKIICLADNIIPHEKRPGDVPFTKYFIKPVDAFITMSEKVLSDLKNIAPLKPVTCVSHPLYDNFGAKISKAAARRILGIPEHENIILFFGFIRKYKGLDILLDAMKLLHDKGKKIRLLVAGEFCEDSKVYLEKIQQLGIDGQLILRTNFIPDSEVKNYLCSADLVVQPYRSATQSGVTPLAYHFEIPMVVTNVGGLPDLVPDNVAGLVAEPDASSIANKIEEYFEKGEGYYLPGLKEEKKKYSWRKMTKAIFSSAQIKAH